MTGVTPEVLEKSLSTVTDGLSLAFDCTALALTMTAMFLSFLVERAEQGVLEGVDRYVDRSMSYAPPSFLLFNIFLLFCREFKVT